MNSESSNSTQAQFNSHWPLQNTLIQRIARFSMLLMASGKTYSNQLLGLGLISRIHARKCLTNVCVVTTSFSKY